MQPSESADAFTIERHGDLTIISATPVLERMDNEYGKQVSDLVLQPVREQTDPQVVFDLSQVDYFGSMFIGLLLSCWKLTTSKGGSMVLSGVSARAKELLRITSLDMVWPMYGSRREAIDALLSN